MAYTLDGIISSVLDYLADNPEVTSLIDAQVAHSTGARREPGRAATGAPAGGGHSPELVNDPQAAGTDPLPGRLTIHPVPATRTHQVQPLIRTQGDTYIDSQRPSDSVQKTWAQG